MLNGEQLLDRTIRGEPCPLCIVCQTEGTLRHTELRDRLFGAEGSWSMRQCRNPGCGLIWLDPMPLPADLGKAYTRYYTHNEGRGSEAANWRVKIQDFMKRGYWGKKYGYQLPLPLTAKIAASVLQFRPIRRREVEADIRCLPAIHGGRLLDVGCGSGDWLLKMRKLDWDVEGLDFDANAVKVARGRGFSVHCGSLEEQKFPSDSYDAVTLSHVIEHLPNPLETLQECARIMKKEGRLVLLTPNGGSLSHRLFGRHWRGLEPPRHLHVFSMKSMHRILEQAGFQQISVKPFVVTSVIYESLLLQRGLNDCSSGVPHSWPIWGATQLFKLLELCLLPFDPSAGDCLIAVAIKR